MATKIVDTLVTRLVFRGDAAALARMRGQIQGLQTGLNRVAAPAMALGTAAAGGIAFIGKAAIDTSRAMQQLEARTGLAHDQLERLKNQAYEVGSALPLDTADIIQLQTNLAQLGASYEEVLALTPTAARFSVAAEGVTPGEAARYAIVGLRNFNLELAESGDLLDQLLYAETKTPALAREIAEGFRFSGKTAADAGLGTHEYIASLGMMAESGRSAEESSQAINSVLLKLAAGFSGVGRGGKMVADVMEAVGLNTDELKETFETGGWFGLLRQFRDVSENVDTSTFQAFLRGLAGETYASAFAALVENADRAEEVATGALNATGESARQARIKMEGVSGAWDEMLAMVDTLRNRLADLGVSDWLEGLFRGISGALNSLLRMDENGELVNKRFLKLGTTLLGVIAVLLPFGLILQGISLALGPFGMLARGLIWVLARLAGASVAAGAGMTAAGTGASAASIGTRLFAGALALLKFTGVVAVLSLIAAGIWLIVQNWDQILPWLQQFGQRFRERVQPLVDLVRPHIQWLSDVWKSVFGVWQSDLPLADKLAKTLLSVIETNIRLVFDTAPKLMAELGKALFEALWAGFTASDFAERIKAQWAQAQDEAGPDAGRIETTLRFFGISTDDNKLQAEIRTAEQELERARRRQVQAETAINSAERRGREPEERFLQARTQAVDQVQQIETRLEMLRETHNQREEVVNNYRELQETTNTITELAPPQEQAPPPPSPQIVVPGLTGPLPTAPLPSAAGVGQQPVTSTRNINVTTGDVIINHTGELNSEEITSHVTEELRRELHIAVRQADDEIAA